MGPLGVPEMLFILVLVLLIFGPKRLPEVGKMVGKGLGEFRRASNELKRSIQTELALEDLEEAPRRRRPPPLPVSRPRPVSLDPPDEPEDAARATETRAAATVARAGSPTVPAAIEPPAAEAAPEPSPEPLAPR
jgi:TatA/E family protein of Tat protein translocase